MSKSIPNDIFQYSLHSAYTAGLKDGGPPVAFLTNHGNHGIGIFENDEEDSDDENAAAAAAANQETSDMIQIDGTAYAISPDGQATPAARDAQLPFVMVTVFQPTGRLAPPARTTSAQLKTVFADAAGRNTTLPFRLTGRFAYINTKQQTVWDVHGTIFGFCIPKWQTGISGEALQCCFLSKDKTHGGRVVDFETADGVQLEWAKCGRFHLGFPQDEEFEELRL